MANNFATVTDQRTFDAAMNDMQKSADFQIVLKKEVQDGVFSDSPVVSMLRKKITNHKISTTPSGGKVLSWTYLKKYSAAESVDYLGFKRTSGTVPQDDFGKANTPMSTYRKTLHYSDRELDFNKDGQLFNLFDERFKNVKRAMIDYGNAHLLGGATTDVNGVTVIDTATEPALRGSRYWIQTAAELSANPIVYGEETRSSDTTHINNQAATVAALANVNVDEVQAIIAKSQFATLNGASGPDLGYTTYTVIRQLQSELLAKNGGNFLSFTNQDVIKFGFHDHVVISGVTILAEKYISLTGGVATADAEYIVTFSSDDLVIATDPKVNMKLGPVLRESSSSHLWFQDVETSEQTALLNSRTAAILSWI